jgi:hypothetical protein
VKAVSKVPIALRVAFGETRPVPPLGGFFVDDLGDQMFGFTKREALIFVTGLLLVTSLCVSGTIYVLQYYLVLHDPADPLVKQGGLKPEQGIRR